MEQRDFFISYTAVNKVWALWVYYILTLYGKTAYIQEYDSKPGEDFREWMIKAIDSSKNFIYIRSRAYARDVSYAMEELSHARAQRAEHKIDIFLPIWVEECPKESGFETIHHIKIFELSECDAIKKLCQAIRCTAIEPVSFPGVEREYAENLCKLGEFYSDGIFHVKAKASIVKANSLFEIASKKGSAAAYHHLGKMRELDGFFEEAYENYEKSANGGYKLAYVELGRLCRMGFEDKTPDYDKAFDYYKQANLPRNPEVMFSNGFFYEHGYAGFQQDDTHACQNYINAIKSGSREAALYLSDFYKNGRGGLQKDMRKAMDYLRRAYDENIDDHISRQADMLIESMEMDFQEAQEIYPEGTECLGIIREISYDFPDSIYIKLAGTYFDGFWKKADKQTYNIGNEVSLKVKGYNRGDYLIVLEAVV